MGMQAAGRRRRWGLPAPRAAAAPIAAGCDCAGDNVSSVTLSCCPDASLIW